MTKKVLDVGNCNPDHSALQSMLTSRYDVQVLRTHGMTDTIATMQSEKVDLVLINRKLDQDYSDGTEILKKIKANPDFAAIPVMIITNYPEHQELAVAMGAEYGFGKLQYKEAATHERLSQFLNLK